MSGTRGIALRWRVPTAPRCKNFDLSKYEWTLDRVPNTGDRVDLDIDGKHLQLMVFEVMHEVKPATADTDSVHRINVTVIYMDEAHF